jgi:hypothetical protein
MVGKNYTFDVNEDGIAISPDREVCHRVWGPPFELPWSVMSVQLVFTNYFEQVHHAPPTPKPPR